MYIYIASHIIDGAPVWRSELAERLAVLHRQVSVLIKSRGLLHEQVITHRREHLANTAAHHPLIML